MTAAPNDPPLAGITVLDLLDEPLAGVTRTYVELGAEVVRREPLGPYGGADPASLAGMCWLAANVGKTLVGDEDEAALATLANRAHLIVQGPRWMTGGSDADALLRPDRRDRRDRTVVMTVSMFGTGHGYERWQATDPVLHALSGELSRSGLAGREPLLPPGRLALACAMAQAAYVGMAALYAALRTGRGDRLDVSMLDAAVQALDPAFGISGSAALGRAAGDLPPGRPARGLLYPILPCADGDVRLCLLAPRQWRAMFEWMGRPEAFADPAFDNTRTRQESAALLAAIAAFFATRSRAELEREGMARGVPIAGLLSLGECLETAHVVAREAIAETRPFARATVRLPNGVVAVDGRRMSALAPAAAAASWQAAAPTGDPARPLHGLKVLDLGVIVVGGEQGRLFADLGADVVKVESTAFPDGTRHSYLPTGLSVSFAAGHRNKRSLGLNLRDPAGRALFLRLAAEADVVLSNFKPGTMEALGLGHDVLAAANPGIVTIESSAFGATGPWRGRMGYGPLVRATAGLTRRWRYPDDPASYSDAVTIYPDHAAARHGATAVLALLLRRLRTGRGGHASLSQLEVVLGDFAAEIAAGGLGVQGVDAAPDAPWGVYRAAGEDEWCVVTVRDDADWRALAGVLGRADWFGTDHATPAARRGRRDAIDRVIAAWMAVRDPDEAMRLLQAAGVPAARMLRAADLQGFGYFGERSFFRIDTHPFMDEPIVAERRHAVSALVAEPMARPAPLMGQHSAEVVREWLGLEEDEIARLIDAGVLEPVPPPIAAMVAAGQGRR